MTTDTNLKLKSKLYYYVARVTNVYDGDTVTVDIDLGLGMWRVGQTIRLWKINTPEVRGSEREEGLGVRDFVRQLVDGKEILLRTILDKRGRDKTGKFGRLLGEILLESDNGEIININQLLIEKGMANELNADGTRTRTLMVPDSVDCAYCGQVRSVNPETTVVSQCTNCLGEEFVLFRAIH